MPNRNLLPALDTVVMLILEPTKQARQDRGDDAHEAEEAANRTGTRRSVDVII
jgi:hypothetical protein